MQIKAKTRSLGIGIGLLVFVIYYVCLAGAKSICETGVIAPSVGMWIPDIILALACAYFIRSSEKDKQISFTFLKFKFYESKDIR
jgi:lipopolysaccharide export system permease protein